MQVDGNATEPEEGAVEATADCAPEDLNCLHATIGGELEDGVAGIDAVAGAGRCSGAAGLGCDRAPSS